MAEPFNKIGKSYVPAWSDFMHLFQFLRRQDRCEWRKSKNKLANWAKLKYADWLTPVNCAGKCKCYVYRKSSLT